MVLLLNAPLTTRGKGWWKQSQIKLLLFLLFYHQSVIHYLLYVLPSSLLPWRHYQEKGRKGEDHLLAQVLITFCMGPSTPSLKILMALKIYRSYILLLFFPLYQFVAGYFVLAYKHGSFRILCRQWKGVVWNDWGTTNINCRLFSFLPHRRLCLSY